MPHLKHKYFWNTIDIKLINEISRAYELIILEFNTKCNQKDSNINNMNIEYITCLFYNFIWFNWGCFNERF